MTDAKTVDWRALGLSHFQWGAFPSVLTLLGDAAPNDLGDTGLPFGPGDQNGAMRWTRAIANGEVASFWSEHAIADALPAMVCGNGQVEAGEVCDDGFTDACGSCNATCSGTGSGSTCGDGTTCPETELCDDGFQDA